MSFWWTLVVVNVIIFLPIYVLNFKVQPNPFYVIMSKELTLGKFIKIPYSKLSSDPFKIIFEFTALILVLRYLDIQSNAAILICTLIGLAGWILIIYAGVMHYVFYRPPVLKSDWQLIQIGLKMTYSQRHWLYIGLVLLISLMTLICYYFSDRLLTMDVEENYIPWVLLIITPLALIKSHRMAYEKIINKTMLSAVMYAYRIWDRSNQYYFPLDRDEEYFKMQSPCQSLELDNYPNLTLIAVESYGSVIYQNPEFLQYVKPVIAQYEKRLHDLGYHMCSGMSESPLIGGGSWKCYTSLTYGIKVDDDALYNMMFKDVDAFESYQSLFHLMKGAGYTNYLLCPLANYEEGAVDWDLLSRNLRTDKYLEYEDMDYQGRPLDFFGDINCPPDQYSINKAARLVRNGEKLPYFLFFVSLNSHYPFLSPTKVVDDWRSLNDVNVDIGVMGKGQERQGTRYAKAIAYQLESFFNHIEDSEEELFVLAGDHQPPRTKLPGNSRLTPIHVITKSEGVIAPFLEQGFRKGLVLDQEAKKCINHEGFLTLFLNGLQRGYGSSSELIEYQPNGIRFSKDDIKLV